MVYLGEATMFTMKIKLFCGNIHAKRVVEDFLLLSKNAFSIEYQPLKPEHIADQIFLFENSRKILSVVMYRVLGVYHCQTYNIC